MNKKSLVGLAIIALAILGYFALKDNPTATPDSHDTHTMAPTGMGGMQSMEQMPDSQLDIVNENIEIPFNQLYTLDDDWSVKIVQFEPSAKIEGPGTIASDMDQESNPAIKANFYKNGDLVHYQISYKDMPGFHSVKPGQKYLLELLNYTGFDKVSENNYSINSANVKLWSIK